MEAAHAGIEIRKGPERKIQGRKDSRNCKYSPSLHWIRLGHNMSCSSVVYQSHRLPTLSFRDTVSIPLDGCQGFHPGYQSAGIGKIPRHKQGGRLVLALISHSTESVKVQARSEDKSGSPWASKTQKKAKSTRVSSTGPEATAKQNKSNAIKKRDWVYLKRSVVGIKCCLSRSLARN